MLETQQTPKDGNGGSGLQDPHSMIKARLLQAQSQLGAWRRPSENRMKPMSRHDPDGASVGTNSVS